MSKKNNEYYNFIYLKAFYRSRITKNSKSPAVRFRAFRETKTDDARKRERERHMFRGSLAHGKKIEKQQTRSALQPMLQPCTTPESSQFSFG